MTEYQTNALFHIRDAMFYRAYAIKRTGMRYERARFEMLNAMRQALRSINRVENHTIKARAKSQWFKTWNRLQIEFGRWDISDYLEAELRSVDA